MPMHWLSYNQGSHSFLKVKFQYISSTIPVQKQIFSSTFDNEFIRPNWHYNSSINRHTRWFYSGFPQFLESEIPVHFQYNSSTKKIFSSTFDNAFIRPNWHNRRIYNDNRPQTMPIIVLSTSFHTVITPFYIAYS